MPKKFPIISILCLLLLSGLLALSAADKPNILFIFADDQSYETIHAHGYNELHTPHLDTLAETGVSFYNAYNMGGWNGAICIASRTMMQTGRFIWRAHAVDSRKKLEELKAKRQTWPQLMEAAGYETYMTGKWHVKIPSAELYQNAVHERGGMPKQVTEGYNRPHEGKIDKWSPFDTTVGGFWEGGKHWSEVVADDAEAFLDQSAGSDNPFFMMLSFNAPHDPRQAPKRFVDMYPQEDIEVPVNYMPSYPYKHEIGLYGTQRENGTWAMQRDENLAPHPRTEYSVRVNRQEYFAIISHMDEQIGRILAKLKVIGEMDNTYIFFTADHGLSVGHHGLIGKQNMYEHSLKVPFMVAGPDIPKGETRNHFIHLQDVMATSLDLAGIKQPDYVEFSSLLPLIENSELESHLGDTVYFAYQMKLQRAIRVGDYKLIVYPPVQTVRLFNLKDDPHEMRDLAGLPSEWDRIRTLFQALLEQQDKMDDPLDLKILFPDLAAR